MAVEKKKGGGDRLVSKNRRASFDYELGGTRTPSTNPALQNPVGNYSVPFYVLKDGVPTPASTMIGTFAFSTMARML